VYSRRLKAIRRSGAHHSGGSEHARAGHTLSKSANNRQADAEPIQTAL